jgi:hypothetical protein
MMRGGREGGEGGGMYLEGAVREKWKANVCVCVSASVKRKRKAHDEFSEVCVEASLEGEKEKKKAGRREEEDSDVCRLFLTASFDSQLVPS